MSGIPQSDYYRHGSHVDFPSEMSVAHGYRVANSSDGGQVKELFYGATAQRSPEVLLLIAMLERALEDLAPPGDSAQRRLAQRSAADWIMSRADGAFSFEWTCWNIGLDAEYVRAGICKRFRLVG